METREQGNQKGNNSGRCIAVIIIGYECEVQVLSPTAIIKTTYRKQSAQFVPET